MNDCTAKAIASVAMSLAVAVAVWKTESARCLWALFFVTSIWA